MTIIMTIAAIAIILTLAGISAAIILNAIDKGTSIALKELDFEIDFIDVNSTVRIEDYVFESNGTKVVITTAGDVWSRKTGIESIDYWHRLDAWYAVSSTNGSYEVNDPEPKEIKNLLDDLTESVENGEL